MKNLTSISAGSIPILSPVYSYKHVLVSYIFLYEATYSFQLDFYMRQQGSGY
ncbi:hypothetical protein ES705_35200 [subsurface metagenome]